jgi:hypothetical protein
MGIETERSHLLVRQMARQADPAGFRVFLGRRISDIFHHRILDMHRPARVATHAGDLRCRIFNLRAESMSRIYERSIVVFVTGQAGFIVYRIGRSPGRYNQEENADGQQHTEIFL